MSRPCLCRSHPATSGNEYRRGEKSHKRTSSRHSNDLLQVARETSRLRFTRRRNNVVPPDDIHCILKVESVMDHLELRACGPWEGQGRGNWQAGGVWGGAYEAKVCGLFPQRIQSCISHALSPSSRPRSINHLYRCATSVQVVKEKCRSSDDVASRSIIF